MTTSSPVAIVTGASSGMGLALARDLVQRGWKVAIADINENKEFAAELGDASTFYKTNVADYDRCDGNSLCDIFHANRLVILVKRRCSRTYGTRMGVLMHSVQTLGL